MSMPTGSTGLRVLEGEPDDDRRYGLLCRATLDLDPGAVYDGGLWAACELVAGHTGPHKRLICWDDQHPDARP